MNESQVQMIDEVNKGWQDTQTAAGIADVVGLEKVLDILENQPNKPEVEPALYEEYLKSKHWQSMRELALERAEFHCAICGSLDQLNVHHNTYERLGCERDADLVVLCRECHKLFHSIE